jgi:hypothetical protein
MNIKGHEILQHTIESYLRACKYNQITGTNASDRMQKEVHQEVIRELGVMPESPDYEVVIRAVDGLVNDLLMKGY